MSFDLDKSIQYDIEEKFYTHMRYRYDMVFLGRKNTLTYLKVLKRTGIPANAVRLSRYFSWIIGRDI
jgi:hypothetical protein